MAKTLEAIYRNVISEKNAKDTIKIPHQEAENQELDRAGTETMVN